MKKDELDKIKQIEKQEKELGTAIKVFSWIIGIIIGILTSYILYKS